MAHIDKERLKRQIQFIVEIDKVKNIFRQTYLADGNRKENDAEHSWHIALMAMLLSEYANEEVDVLKVMTMVLVHDLVEIDAGDTYAYDTEAVKSKRDREVKAADRIFGLLPDDQGKYLRELWDEFEAYETAEAKFAHVMDNFQPLLLNDASDGRSWREHGVHQQQIYKRNEKVPEGAGAIWEAMQEIVAENIEKGNIIPEEMDRFQKLPKIELHCHLDGSMNVEVLKEMLKEQGIEKTDEEILSLVQVEDSNPSLTEYLKKFDLPLQCLVTKESFRKAVYGLLMDARKENVIYMEIRFAPLLSCHDNLSCAEIIEGAVEGIRDAEKEGIRGNLIICAMRHHSVEQNLKLLEETLPYLGKGVCAMDLAGDESGHPTAEQREVFEAAGKAGMTVTLHAGECGDPENIRISKELGAKRIGHGIALSKDESLLEEIKNMGIGIEMCPTSNQQTKAVENFELYPMKKYLDAGLLVSLNTDNRTVSGTTLTREMYLAKMQLGITDQQQYQMQKNAADTAFVNEETRKELLKQLKDGWNI